MPSTHPMKHPNQLSWKYAAILAAAALAVRLPLLFGSERALDGDESAVGMMAFHIAFRGEHPLLLYGSSYGGGHTIVAHITALLFRLLGPSDIAVDAVTVAVSIILLLLVSAFAAKTHGERTGFLAGLLLAFLPPYLKASFQTDAYMETMCFVFGAAWILFFRLLPGKPNITDSSRLKALFGFSMLCGVAVWSYEFSALFVAFWLLVIIANLRRFDWKEYALMVFLFFVGSIFLWLTRFLLNDGAASAFSRWTTGSGTTAAEYLHRAGRAFTHSLPSWFGPYLYEFPKVVPWYSWFIFLLFALSVVYAAWNAVAALSASRRAPDENPWPRVFFGLFPVFFLLLYPLFYFANRHPRYFLPLAPFFAVALADLLVRAGALRGIVRIAALAFLLSCAAVGYGSGVWAVFSVRNPSTNGNWEHRNIVNALHFFESNHIDRVYAGHFVKWQLVFCSKERLIAASDDLDNLLRYMPYETVLIRSHSPSYLLPADSPHLLSLKDYLAENHIGFEEKSFGSLVAIYGIESNVQPRWRIMP